MAAAEYCIAGAAAAVFLFGNDIVEAETEYGV